MYVVVRGLNRVFIHTHRNKVMTFLKIEKKYSYIWICHGENNSGFVLFNMGFHKFEHRHENMH
jgi:hypothetical protein